MTSDPSAAVRRPSLLLRAALVLALTLAILFALEGGARIVQRLRTGDWSGTRLTALDRELAVAATLYRTHPYLVVAPHEGARVAVFGKHAGFSSLGYRSPERPLAKPAGTRRILCVGGSTTFDLLAERDEATWPWLLEDRLRAGGERVEVWNAGFPGWTSLESTLSLAVRDADLRPDLVIVFHGLNDLRPGSHRSFDRQYEHGHAELARRVLGLERDPLTWAQRSVLVEGLGDLLRGGPTNPWTVRTAPASTARAQRLPAAAVAVFGRNLRSLAGLAAAHGAKVLFVTQRVRIREPSAAADRDLLAQWLPGLEPSAVPAELERLDDVTRLLAAEGVGTLADAAREVPWTDGDFADAMHFSEQGSRALAAYLQPRVAHRAER